jgi:hypothetical protein
MTREQKIEAIRAFERERGFPLDSIVNVIIFETAGTISTTIRNRAGSGAVGLFQFMPATLSAMGYTVQQVLGMSFAAQLQLCGQYLAPYDAKLKQTQDPLDFYLAVLYPALMGRTESAIMAARPSVTYTQNIGLDSDGDGTITKADIRAYFEKSVNTYRDNFGMEPVTIKPGNGFVPVLASMAIALIFF